MTLLVGATAVVVGAIVKGVIGSGFPTVATPLLALVVDVKIAVAVLVVPNLVMDAIQARRRGDVRRALARLAPLLAGGAGGTVLGTRLLLSLSPRAVSATLGAFVLLFVAMNATRLAPTIPPGARGWLAAPVGFVAGVVGGITNVPGTPLSMYFYALRLEKHEYVQSLAVSFIVLKLVQLAAVGYYGLLSWPIAGVSLVLTLLALVGFGVGLQLQDRLDQAAFNRAVLVFLAALGAWLLLRASL